jgi:hypothetical protein
MAKKEAPAVAVYNTHVEAEEAVKWLQKAGFAMKKLSIVGKDYHTEEHVGRWLHAVEDTRAAGESGPRRPPR